MRFSKRDRSQVGFTLTELLITVALVGVLAAIAIPNFVRYQARARRSEGFTHVAGIARAYKAFHAEQGRYPDTQADSGFVSLPDTASLGTAKLPWDNDTENFFKTVGWRPDGSVYYTYEIESDCGGVCSDQTCFTVIAHGDVDANGSMAQILYVHPLRDAAGTLVPGGECVSAFAPLSGVPTNPKNGTSVYDEPAVYLVTDPY
jgi:type IV pilus assembly protein PilA